MRLGTRRLIHSPLIHPPSARRHSGDFCRRCELTRPAKLKHRNRPSASAGFKNVLVSDAARESVENSATYANYYYHMGRFIARLMNRAAATPEKVAGRIIKLMSDPDPPLRVAASIDARFFTLMTRLLPRRLYHYLLYRNLPGVQLWGSGNHDALNQASQLEDVIPPPRNNDRSRETSP